MTSKTDKPKTLDSFLRKVDSAPTTKFVELTVAQSIRSSSNPMLAAVSNFSRREILTSEDHLHDKKIFHFEDKSFLVFEVNYTAIEDGI